MSQHFILNSVDLGVEAIRLGQIPGWITRAELGSAGMCGVPLDDLTGTLATTGWKPFIVTEDACASGNQRLFTGYVADRQITRRNSSSLITGGARSIQMNVTDQNAVLSMRLFPPTDTAANRSSETDLARIAWLLSTAYTGGSVSNLGLVSSTGGITMDAADYRGQSAMSLLNDCASASGKNFFVYFDESAGSLGLFYDFDYSTVYSSTASFSNVLADVQADVANSYYNLMLASAPISYWRLGEATPGTGTAVDVMGANNGTYVGSPTGGVTGALTGDPNTAVTFNGSTQYVTVPDASSLRLSAGLTCAAWVKFASSTLSNHPIISKWASNSNYLLGIDYGSSASKMIMIVRIGGVSKAVVSPSGYTDGLWHFVVGTWDGANVLLFVDGAAVGTPTVAAGTADTGNAPVAIGAYADGSQPFPGSIDEPAIWNRALSAAEVAALYAAAPVRTAQGASSCFALGDDWQLNVDPSLVYSGAQVPFSGTGSPVYVTRSATASLFIARDTTAPNVNTKSSATATASGNRYLASLQNEDQKITGTVRLPAAHVNDVLAGQRVQVKCTYMAEAGMDSAFVYLRVLSREVKQDELSDQFYNVYYELTPPSNPHLVACSYIAVTSITASSLDVFGGYLLAGGSYAAPATPPPVTSWITGGSTLYGTPDDGSSWGITAGVLSAPFTVEARWNFDLATFDAAAACHLFVDLYGGSSPGPGPTDLEIQASDDGVTWTTVLSFADVGTRGSWDLDIPTDLSVFRYWSLHFYFVQPGSGPTYFPGIDIVAFMLWAGTVG